jgi:hypothetical protein
LGNFLRLIPVRIPRSFFNWMRRRGIRCLRKSVSKKSRKYRETFAAKSRIAWGADALAWPEVGGVIVAIALIYFILGRAPSLTFVGPIVPKAYPTSPATRHWRILALRSAVQSRIERSPWLTNRSKS